MKKQIECNIVANPEHFKIAVCWVMTTRTPIKLLEEPAVPLMIHGATAQEIQILTVGDTSKGYRKTRLSQQLLKVFISIYILTATCFGLYWPSSGEAYNCMFRLKMASEGRNMYVQLYVPPEDVQ
jgi:hypothetical protein